VLDLHTPQGATGLAIALSGGADSAALLLAAAGLGESLRGLRLRAVHVDHGMQAAAASFRSERLALCTRLQIPLTVIAVAVEAPPGCRSRRRRARLAMRPSRPSCGPANAC
jgi:tRNA(Ile)-lysidine synthase